MQLRATRLTAIASAVKKLFSPASLFANGEQGVWYDPSDMSTLFQDAAGTIPVTAVEQPVGRILDKSGRGNHATQTTATSRPVLSARVNLLTKTERFDDAVWTKATNTSATSSKISATSNGTLAFLQVLQTLSKDADRRTYVATIEAKEAELRYLGATLQEPFVGTNGVFVHTDLRDAAQINQGVFGSGFTLNSVQRTLLSDGYCRIVITATTNAAASVTFGLQPSKNSTFLSTAYVAGEGVFVRNADLRAANNALNQPAYQRVNTATDYDTAGFPNYLRFDGVDDWLVTPSINFTATDKMTVFAGVRKLSDADSIIAETSINSGLSNGSIMFRSAVSGNAGYYWRSYGSLLPSSEASVTTGYSAPISNVLTGLGNISGDSSILRINGSQVSIATADQGTGNYGNYPLYIGRRGGTTLPFNGHLYSLIVLGAQSTAQQVTQTEQWVNGKTGAY